MPKKKLTVALGALGLNEWTGLDWPAVTIICAFLVAQAAVDMMLVWKGKKNA